MLDPKDIPPDMATRKVVVPKGAPTQRFFPLPEIELPKDDPAPFIGSADDPPEKQMRVHWKVQVRVFKLPDEQDAYSEAWQKISDGHAAYCSHSENFDPATSRYVALLRWADYEYKLPERPTDSR